MSKKEYITDTEAIDSGNSKTHLFPVPNRFKRVQVAAVQKHRWSVYTPDKNYQEDGVFKVIASAFQNTFLEQMTPTSRDNFYLRDTKSFYCCEPDLKNTEDFLFQ